LRNHYIVRGKGSPINGQRHLARIVDAFGPVAREMRAAPGKDGVGALPAAR